MSSVGKRIAIVGAGPVGLEAALRGVSAGFQVQVFERGVVAQNLKEWGHVRMFSPFGVNSTELGRGTVAAHAASPLPDLQTHLTGWDFAERYLVPLSAASPLATRVSERTEVLAIGRSQFWKTDSASPARRQHDPFQLLVRTVNGTERLHTAEFVFDCSGTYPHHRWLGAGGIPCPGEISCAARVDYLLPDLLGKDRSRFAGKKTLVVGSGYSAATAVAHLAELAADEPRTRIFWVTRSESSPPCARVPNDPFEPRDKLASWVNRLAIENKGLVRFMPGRLIRGLEFRVDRGKFLVLLDRLYTAPQARHPDLTVEQLAVDCVIANVGYRPNRALHEELHLDECHASQALLKMAATLSARSSSSRVLHDAEALRNPEPGFFILGAKSYGRDSRFLIQDGLQQIGDVFSLIDRDLSLPVGRTSCPSP